MNESNEVVESAVSFKAKEYFEKLREIPKKNFNLNVIKNAIPNIDNNNCQIPPQPIDYKKYSKLCEKRIKQLCPNQTFPITINDLSKNNCLSSMEIRIQIKDTELIKLKNEIDDLKTKNSILQEQNQNFLQSKEKIIQTLKTQKNTLIFPPPNHIPFDKLMEGYTRLYEAFNKIANDKEVAVVSLQNEILLNDQQRNYIEILKQTLESNLIKNGININNNFEGLFNVINLQKIIDDLSNRNNALELEKNKLISDINDLNNSNEIYREQITESLNNGIKELEEAKRQIKILEKEKQNLSEELTLINTYNSKLKNKLESFDKSNIDINEKIINYQKRNQTEIDSINEDYLQLKNEYELLNRDNKENLQLIENLKQENENLIQQLNSKNTKTTFLSDINETNNMNEKSTFKSISRKCNASNLTCQRYFGDSAAELSSSINNNNTYQAKYTQQENNFTSENINSTNSPLTTKEIAYLQNLTFVCLNDCHEFIKFCISKSEENTSVENGLKDNDAWLSFVNNITNLSYGFQNFYNCLSNISCKINNNNASNTQFSNLNTNDETPIKMELTGTKNSNDINIENNNILKEIEKYKEDNKIMYLNCKKLEKENMDLFFVNKENKFYYKLISRILQYHINNQEVKSIINKLVSMEGQAIRLDMEKNQTKIKIDDINRSSSSSSSSSKESFNKKEIIEDEELENLKKKFNQMEKELNEKFIAIKNLDKELRSFENR